MTDALARGLALVWLSVAHAAHAQEEAPVLPAPGLPAEIQAAAPRTGSGTSQPDPAIVADLRREYEDLKAREAELALLNGPATAETLAELERARQRLEEFSAPGAVERWKAETMIYFRDAFRNAGPLVLPPDTPAGLKLALAPAVADAETSFFAAPDVNSAVLSARLTQRTTVLHVADGTPFSFVWVPDVGFAFVLKRSLEVYN